MCESWSRLQLEDPIAAVPLRDNILTSGLNWARIGATQHIKGRRRELLKSVFGIGLRSVVSGPANFGSGLI